ncbi:MAG TPA: hypothetical protein VF796_11160, partial [Humisphaera sp.]
VYRAHERVGVGSVATVYRCTFYEGPTEVQAVLKVARDARVNGLLANEAAVLHRLHAADPANRHTPFLPYPQATFGIGDEGPAAPARQATVLRVHPQVRSPADELYTLAEVRAAFPQGLDPRHVAWVWRRVLTVLAFAHRNGVVHGQVLPPHVMIEPREHKLVLVDWTCAAHLPSAAGRPLAVVAGPYLPWFKREAPSRNPVSPAVDVALAARTMIDLLGGDGVTGRMPPATDPALQRHFSRCINLGPNARPEADRLLADFDRLIEALWGPRQFVPLHLPPKRR